MKLLLAIFAYFAILWGRRKFSKVFRTSDKPSSDTTVDGEAKESKVQGLDPENIVDANFSEIKDDPSNTKEKDQEKQ